MELELEWKGPYRIDEETPKDMKGLHGLFANLYDSRIVYVGRASGKSHLFQESKFRYRSLKRGLIELGVLAGPLLPIDRAEIEKVAEDHCRKYVGVLLDENKLKYLECAENLLIFKKEPPGNEELKYAYECVVPFSLINKGEKSILSTLGLRNYKIVHRAFEGSKEDSLR